MLELAMLASHVISHVISHVTVGIVVVVYSWVDPINTPYSSTHHIYQQISPAGKVWFTAGTNPCLRVY